MRVQTFSSPPPARRDERGRVAPCLLQRLSDVSFEEVGQCNRFCGSMDVRPLEESAPDANTSQLLHKTTLSYSHSLATIPSCAGGLKSLVDRELTPGVSLFWGKKLPSCTMNTLLCCAPVRAPAAWSRTIICTTHMREGAEAVAKHTPTPDLKTVGSISHTWAGPRLSGDYDTCPPAQSTTPSAQPPIPRSNNTLRE